MTYNPNVHHRRSIRLKGYDYSKAGAYFITICCKDMKCRFGKVENEEMIFNEFGSIANDEWLKLPERFPNFELDVFQIMPNHMHGIIVLNETPVGVGFTPTQNMQDKQKNVINEDVLLSENRAGVNPARTVNPVQTSNPNIGDIVGAYKSLVANACLDIYKSKNKILGKLWQRDYYEHIIRNEKSYLRISDYIINNPAKWNADKFFDR